MMGAKTKKEIKKWQEQEKIKLVAIAYAFSIQTDDKIEINSDSGTENGGDK